MDVLVNTASTTFQTTTGFAITDVVSWMSDLAKLVIGTGLALLETMLPWILALIVIGAIVYFLYRGMKFFRH